jgi:hypothetical protein
VALGFVKGDNEMAEHILTGHGKEIVPRPAEPWRVELDEVSRAPSPRLAFMKREHHLVRDAAVTELARVGRALPPERLAELTDIPADRVRPILEQLESRLFFLVRDEKGSVSWAYPVTSETTPHRLRFSTGETVNAA